MTSISVPKVHMYRLPNQEAVVLVMLSQSIVQQLLSC